MKQSRLLSRLDAEIAGSSDTITLHCLRIERACYLARRGEIDEARATVVEFRKRYQQEPNVVISTWLSLAEGMLIHFSDMGQQARDKFHRANALSAAAGLSQMNALSAAWLAHMDYLAANMTGMSRFARQALQLAEPSNHSALSRANLVIALAYHLAGRLDLAKAWYAKTHLHATAEGDDATMSALLHNIAWLRAANMRQETLSGRVVSPSGEHALSGVESTLQFDSFVGTTSLQALSPILLALIHTTEGKFSEGLAGYQAYLPSAIEQGMARMHANLLADQAWCRINLGQTQAARIDALAAEKLVDPKGHLDDRAATHSRLAQVFEILGESETSAKHHEMAKAAWDGHCNLQQHIIEVLDGIRP